MWITKTSIRHPVFATMVMVGLMVLGLFSYKSLGVESMPNIDVPAAWVETIYPGASPEQVENDVTRPIEEVANTVSGIKTVRSNSWEGRSGVSLEFTLETDTNRAIQDLRDKIAQVRGRFPREVRDPVVIRQNGEDNTTVAIYAVTARNHSMRDLSTLTDQVITKRLQAVAGVGQIYVNGQTNRQVLVQIRPEQLQSLHVGVDEVVRAIQATNANLPAGSIIHGRSERMVRIEGMMKTARDFNNIIVARRADGPIYLSQVATVVDGEQEEQSLSRVNGVRAISLQIGKVQDANTVQVGDGVKKAIEDMQKSLPPDV